MTRIKLATKLQTEISLIENALAKQPYPWANTHIAVMRIALLKHRIEEIDHVLTEFFEDYQNNPDNVYFKTAKSNRDRRINEIKDLNLTVSYTEIVYEEVCKVIDPVVLQIENEHEARWDAEDKELGIFTPK